MALARRIPKLKVRILKDKYTNWKDKYYVTKSFNESTIPVTSNVKEAWRFEGEQFTRVIKNDAHTTAIPLQTLSIEEFMAYSDEINRMMFYLFEKKPVLPKK
ncbi:hypothetical protein LCGC14_1004470 [marine sediment metagenome]|uniref:Uncharacterized protein n=1 Tax=marine sediment metagenome TaxID=412755 RepID=A0A0F9N6R3_9ZZZZ